MIRVLAIVAACAIGGPAYGQASSKEAPEAEGGAALAGGAAEAEETTEEEGVAPAQAVSGEGGRSRAMGDTATGPQIFHSQYFPEETLVGECRLNRDLCVQRAADDFCQKKGFTQSMGYNMERRTRSVGVSWHAQFITCVLFMRPRAPDPRLEPAAETEDAAGGASQ